MPRENVVSAQHLASVAKPILKLSEGKHPNCIQLSLDRLAQAVQVIMESNSMYGKKREYFEFLI